MAILRETRGDRPILDVAVKPASVEKDTIEARRARRMAALKKVAGIWSQRSDIPADGLEYQRALRSEWGD
ncbi:MAG: hypothetical protein V4857_15135 [Pseudomonadota bacterium]